MIFKHFLPFCWLSFFTFLVISLDEQSVFNFVEVPFTYLLKKYLFGSLGLRCSTWDLASWPGFEPRHLHWGVRNLSDWTNREAVPVFFFGHFGCHIWEALPNPRLKAVFSPKSYMVLALIHRQFVGKEQISQVGSGHSRAAASHPTVCKYMIM